MTAIAGVLQLPGALQSVHSISNYPHHVALCVLDNCVHTLPNSKVISTYGCFLVSGSLIPWQDIKCRMHCADLPHAGEQWDLSVA